MRRPGGPTVIRGTIILESLRVDASLTGFRMVVTEVGRGRPKLSPEQVAAGIPELWCGVDFELEDEKAGELVIALSAALAPGWYANFCSATETFIIYPGRTFRYPRRDPARRAEAHAYGRTLGIPDHQLDWTE
jgi:hypothetical protein